MHASASVAGTTIATTDTYETVEGNIYFPPSAVSDPQSVLEPSDTTTHCPWKGTASYYNLHVDGKVIQDAAWYYPEPKDAARNIKGYLAFCGCLFHLLFPPPKPKTLPGRRPENSGVEREGVVVIRMLIMCNC